MSIDLQDEILQDFLVEAGEILELLGEQLVELEQRPDDMALINAIFRGFHTVKGGAGFLALTELVNISHKTEDVFNLLRQGQRVADTALMDVILRSLDVVNDMFAGIQEGNEPQAADAELLNELTQLAEVSPPQPPTAVADPDDELTQQGASATENTGSLSENAYRAMPGLLNNQPAVADDGGAAPPSDDISEEEFEQLLDTLHGKGRHSGRAPGKVPVPPEPVADEASADSKAGDDNISDDEFQAILDQMHGAGKGPTRPKAPVAQTAVAVEAAVREAPAAGTPLPSNPKATARTSLKAVPKAAPAIKAESSVRVDTKCLDDIMNLVGELVLARNRLTSLRNEYENEQMVQAVNNLDLVTADLQGAVMKTRMQPVRKVFGRFPRVVRDLARNLNKEVHLELVGEDTDLDKNLVEALADPLVHLVRNSVDHGIELPAARKAAGKSPCGTVVLSAEQAGDHILLTIADDGAGMNPDTLREMAVRKGIMDTGAANRLTDKECFELIFMPGTSTKTEISDVSGRGVGMDVVKTRITQLNGSVEVDSVEGKGTTLSIKVPLTLAILPTLMVVLGGRKFALPLSIVNEIFELNTKPTHIVDGQRVIQNRGKAPPLFYLRNWLLSPEEANESSKKACNGEQVLMVQIDNRPVGFVVDQVIGQEEVVIKPLGSILQGLPGLAGATITGNGNMALILDMPGLLRRNASLG